MLVAMNRRPRRRASVVAMLLAVAIQVRVSRLWSFVGVDLTAAAAAAAKAAEAVHSSRAVSSLQHNRELCRPGCALSGAERPRFRSAR